jgi:hypothetical protein
MDVYAETGTDGATFLWVLDPLLFGFGATRAVAWQKVKERADGASLQVVEEVRGPFTVQDADTTAIFRPEREAAMRGEVVDGLACLDLGRESLIASLARIDPKTFDHMPPHRSNLPTWATWRTIRQIANHVAYCEAVYYPSRILDGVGATPDYDRVDVVGHLQEAGSEVRRRLTGLDDKVLSIVRERSGELWSVRKVLRRLRWHQGIHARSIARIAAGRPPRAGLKAWRAALGASPGRRGGAGRRRHEDPGQGRARTRRF